MRSGRPWRRSSRRNAIALVALSVCVVASRSITGFVGASHSLRRPLATLTRLSALSDADQAWASVEKEFSAALEAGTYFGTPCNKGTVLSMFSSFSSMFGKDVALEIAVKEPIVLLGDISSMQKSFEVLKSFEGEDQKGLACEAVRKNPRLLTIPGYEFERTKPSLASLDQTASAIDFLRPIGELGLAVVIFGSFIVLILVLRPIFYGVGGGPSVIAAVTGGVTGGFDFSKIPRPFEIAEQYGINLAAFVAIIPIVQVYKAFTNRKDPAEQEKSLQDRK